MNAASRIGWDWTSPGTILLAVLALGLAPRLAAALLPIFYHTDEVWQYLEPAHHLAGGRWVVPWEYRDGVRGWLVPAILSAPALLGDLIAPASDLATALQKLLLVTLSLGIIASAAGMGLRISRLHGFIAGFAAAIWFELIYFAPRAMSEAIALALVFPALYLLTAPPETHKARLMLAAGMLLGLAFCVRFHLAPALLVLAAFGCGRRLRKGWLPLVAGGVAALAIGGLADMLAGDPPLMWIVHNVTANIVDDKASTFGTEPFYWYFKQIVHLYGFMSIPGAALVVLGARRCPAAFWAAAINLAVHAAIPHKEVRFMLFSTALLIFLASLGTADLLARLSCRWREARGIVGACTVWLAVSAACGFTQPFVKEWTRNQALVLSLAQAAHEPAACGLALLQPRVLPGGAYAFYDRDTPIYLFIGTGATADARASSPAFNLVISERNVSRELGPDYVLRTCPAPSPGAPGFCLYVRPGRCTAAPDAGRHEINAVLRRHGY